MDILIKLLWFSILFIIVFAFIFHFATRKYVNPYKLTMVFGKKGCGKTTMLTKLAYQYSKKGKKVFCTDKAIENTIYIPVDMVGHFWLPEDSVLLVDEVGMIWDNRDFKKFESVVRDWFKYQRHNKVRVYLFSQSFDIDKKLRDLTDEMFLLSCKMRVFSYGKKIKKSIVLNNSSAEAPANIAENFEFYPFILFPFGTRILTYIPKWSGKFDSHSRLGIPDLLKYFTIEENRIIEK